jgi:hypothetical protein
VGEAAGSEGVNQKGKRISQEDETDAWAGWAGQALSRAEDGAASGLAGLRGRVGRKVGWAEIKKKNF